MTTQRIIGLLIVAFIVCLAWALFFAPADEEMGDAYRVIFVHVPSAFMSLLVYMVMGICAIASMLEKYADCLHRLIRALAPVGALMTLLALLTGAIWGHRMWGTWWTWHDARLVSELILLFLYLGYMLLVTNIPHEQTANKIGSILLMIGLVNIPIIHFSVTWWTSLHQPPTLLRFDKPAMDAAMRHPLLAIIVCFIAYVVCCAWLHLRLQQKRKA